MRWLEKTVQTLKEATTAEPVHCPRGWGEIRFQTNFQTFLPFLSMDRKCPVGGVECCSTCRHPHNPENLHRLREALSELEKMRSDNVVSEAEYEHRRRLIVCLEEGPADPTRAGAAGFRTAAWIIGPMGLVLTAAGTLALIQWKHEGLWALVGAGALLLTLCFSFAVLSRRRDAAPKPKAERY